MTRIPYNVRRTLGTMAAGLVATLALTLGGCSGEVNDGLPTGVTCTSCHGSEFNAAPPVAVNGEETTGYVGVGAHQAHLSDGTIRKSVGCGACHVVPLTITQDGHIDALPAEVHWGVLSRIGAAEPAWDRDAETCSSTYCHGATLSGGKYTAPVWTDVQDGPLACDACHGSPPPTPHPQVAACAGCHPETVTESGLIDVEGGRHIDGVLQVVGTGCSGCHGSEENPAPPTGLNGSSDTADIAVGAHQSHLHDSAVRKAIACSECHRVPGTVDQEGHLGDLPAELTFGALATTDGAAPAWNRNAATCSSTYCHGGTISGGAATEPVWTTVDGSQAACDSCHGSPPPAPHPAVADCGLCHPGTLTADGAIDVAGGQHIDGQLQVIAGGCSACHGSDTNAAPPRALDGAGTTTDPGVGAHQAHLAGGTVRAAITCEDCHPVPATLDAAGHIDGSPVEFAWGALATTDGATPGYAFEAGTCSSTYCHGGTLTGGVHTAPTWTLVDGSQLSCASCHGFPPPAPHPQNPNCQGCHPGTLLPSGEIDLAAGQHINGAVDIAESCVACHGGDAGPAPPVALDGSSDVGALGVGAHQAHLQGGDLRAGIACGECHPPVTSVAAHIDDFVADLAWGTLATTGPVTPAWDRGAATCSSVYCHGTTLAGGSLTAPVWTDDSGAAATCGACHGAPPPEPHPQLTNCRTCHPGTLLESGDIDVAGGLHIDGEVEIATSCTACHGSDAGPAPPAALDGSTDTDSLGVGAHQAHLQGGTVRSGIACTECHTVPATVDAAGHLDGAPADLTWGELATDEGVQPEWDREAATCSTTYCHGATLSGGTHKTPVWTEDGPAVTSCASCHGFPPLAPHPQSFECRTCHPDTIQADGGIDIEGGFHINGEIDSPF